MTVPITSDLEGYQAYWRTPILFAEAAMVVVILLLVIIAWGVWRR